MDSKFDPERLKLVARKLAAEDGIEKTPEQWEEIFRGMIASYRESARRAGRHDAASLPDDQVWARIVRYCEGGL
jgi:hypothetical protein